MLLKPTGNLDGLRPCFMCHKPVEQWETDDMRLDGQRFRVACECGVRGSWAGTPFEAGELWNASADEERILLEAIPAVLCDICKQPSKGIKIRCGDQSVSVCQRCIDRWHKGAAGPFGTRQLYSVSPAASSASQ